MPAALASEVWPVAKERHFNAAYKRFMDESEPTTKNEAGLDLIRAIFGKDSIAEDSVR